MELRPPASGAWSLSPQSTREVPFLITESLYLLTTSIQFCLLPPTASGDHKSDLLSYELFVSDEVLIISLMGGQPYAIFVFICIFPPDIVKHSYGLSSVRIMELAETSDLKPSAG